MGLEKEVLDNMYASYFGLKENPFNLTPDPKYLFLSQRHNEALDHLLYGINERKGFIAIVGGIGMGKTTLCRALLNQTDDSTKTALIFNTSISEAELLETINQEFGIDTGGTKTNKKEQIDRLNAFLLKNFAQGGNAVLVFDEAQNLSPAVLEQIRMLSNLETDKEKLIQIVLVGQPELRKLLAARTLKQLNERIMVWYQLEGLDRHDMQHYIEHRLVVAGGRGNLKFTGGALSAIHAYSRGVPRRINAVCDRALLIAYCRDEFVIKKSTILKAIEDIKGDFGQYHAKAGWFQSRVASAAAMLMVFIIATFGGWHFRDQLSGLFSVIEKADVVESKAFIRRPIDYGTFKAQKRPASLVLDKRASLAGLFKLFNVQEAESIFGTGEVYPGLFSFEGAPRLYRMFRKPLRLRIKAESEDEVAYLLIREVTSGGAIALDAEGKERLVGEEFILKNWDGEMSWVYPYEQDNKNLTEGMRGQNVLKVQQMLQQMGYSLQPTGLYDSATLKEVMRFQRILGLEANGIVGTRTKALLYQMSG